MRTASVLNERNTTLPYESEQALTYTRFSPCSIRRLSIGGRPGRLRVNVRVKGMGQDFQAVHKTRARPAKVSVSVAPGQRDEAKNGTNGRIRSDLRDVSPRRLVRKTLGPKKKQPRKAYYVFVHGQSLGVRSQGQYIMAAFVSRSAATSRV
jgi:hypothetical protein